MPDFEEQQKPIKTKTVLRYSRRIAVGGARTAVGAALWMGKRVRTTLRFEEEKSKAEGHSEPRRHKLKFTAAEQAEEAPKKTTAQPNSETAANKQDKKRKPKKEKAVKGYRGGKRFAKDLKQDVGNEITKLADSSENDAVRGADRERKIVGVGAKYGGRVGKWHRGGRDARLDKRQAKKMAREIKLEHRSKHHFELYGDELPSKFRRERKQQKRQMKRKQIKEFAQKKLGERTVDIAVRLLRAVGRTSKKAFFMLLSYIAFPLLGVVVIIALLFGMAAMMLNFVQSSAVVMLSSYTSAEADLEAASVLATKLEAELEKEINDIPLLWKWEYIDEFRYDLDPIGHDPFELMGYLSVTYPGFEMGQASPVPDAITALHDKRYELITEQQTETRYYEETYTDPVTGEEKTETVAYDYYILNIILRSKSILEAVKPELAATPEGELWEWYKVLEETAGARQEFENPFTGSDWRGSVTSLYGYRIDPLGGKGLQLHKGLDIAAAGGTPIAAGIAGRVRYVGNDAYFGNYIILESEEGVTMKYAHCRSISAQAGSEVEAGEEIATVGSTGASSGNHLHIEIKRDGRYINPIYALKFGGKDDEK